MKIDICLLVRMCVCVKISEVVILIQEKVTHFNKKRPFIFFVNDFLTLLFSFLHPLLSFFLFNKADKS